MLKIGDKAPNFSLLNQNGKKVFLKDYIGKKIVLYFYPKDMTSGCTKEGCDFRDHIKIFEKHNTVVLGISCDSVESHKKFSDKYDFPFSILSDGAKKIVQDYGVWKQKNMYGRKYYGIERTTFIIDEKGKVEKIFSKVNVKNHIKELLDLLES